MQLANNYIYQGGVPRNPHREYVAQPVNLEPDRIGYAIKRTDQWLAGIAQILFGTELKIELLKGGPGGDRLRVSIVEGSEPHIPLDNLPTSLKFLLRLYERQINLEYKKIVNGQIALPLDRPSYLELITNES